MAGLCARKVFMGENDIVMVIFMTNILLVDITQSADIIQHNLSTHNATFIKALYLCIEMCRFQCSKIFLVAWKIELNIRKKVSNYSLMICLSNPWSTLYILETFRRIHSGLKEIVESEYLR